MTETVSDAYERLAKRLDELPNGYPATESGVELAILRKIFSPDEAQVALGLSPMPETAENMAERLAQPVEAVRAKLQAMAANGEIGCPRSSPPPAPARRRSRGSSRSRSRSRGTSRSSGTRICGG